MSLQEKLVADLQLRGRLLLEEVARMRVRIEPPPEKPDTPDRTAAQDANTTALSRDWMTLHRSQVLAVREVMLDALIAKQEEALARLDPQAAALDFASAHEKAELAILGAQSIMAVLRYALDQRQDRRYYGDALDLADLVAADCYTPFIRKVVGWGAGLQQYVFTSDRERPPPLVVLNAKRSPAALTRNVYKLSKFDDLLEANSGAVLPITIISLPFGDTAAIWRYCSIYHEVGHALESDLQLAGVQNPDNSLRPFLNQLPPARRPLWAFWLREVVADAFGILLGGAGFAYALLSLLFQPLAAVASANAADQHPPAYVRVFLLASLLRETEAPSLQGVADEIEQLWQSIYSEADLPPAGESPEQALPRYRDDCPQMAKLVLNQKLPALFNRCLRDFAALTLDGDEIVDPLEKDHSWAAQLAACLVTGEPRGRPDPSHFPYRLVPAAAQLALQNQIGIVDNALAADQLSGAIHNQALTYASGPGGIPRPRFLGPHTLTGANHEHLRNLVMNFDFAGPQERSD